MIPLHDRLSGLVDGWRIAGYPSEPFPAIGEILEWCAGAEAGNVSFLRRPQLRALETYWYLRLVKSTPHITALYAELYPKQTEYLTALGLGDPKLKDIAIDEGKNALLDRIKTDDELVRQFSLEAVRETLTLDYPSYILALAMGAGKTILIGAIIATEFAMAIEYREGPFVQNALVFAPGKTILESLRELLQIPYERLLPPRLHKAFAASLKLTFTRDGEKDLPVIRGSIFNVVVTNTEKIRIQKESIRKSDIGLFAGPREDEARTEIANLRLQAIASLPHLAVFSDEAHHTYGQSLEAELKKVRKTVDYLATNTNLVCVINTTGTPYYQRQPLKDVVIWYGLSQGIRDGILKDVAGNIQSFDFSGDTARYVKFVILDFFKEYGDVHLPNGSPAKMAVYFPQTDDLKELRPVIDQALVEAGQSPALALVNTSDPALTKQGDIDAFNRLNDPAAPHRVILLVNKGTEGWNCPSLFACALARKLKSSNNFVLQAATRCLRQVPGNTMKARIYLSSDNFSVLDRQLKETYGEEIADLNRSHHETTRARVVLRKLDVPPLVVTQCVRMVVRAASPSREDLELERPAARGGSAQSRTYTLGEHAVGPRVLQQVGETIAIESGPDVVGSYTAAVELAARYRLDSLDVREKLIALYPDGDVPTVDLPELCGQIERQTRTYEVKEEHVDNALALVKEGGFVREIDASGAVVYTAEIVYPTDREQYLRKWDDVKSRFTADFGFCYSPVQFDSLPELSFFEQMLDQLKLKPADVEDFYFTGGLTDPAKTDFFVEYKDDHGKWRRYTPDFVLRKKAAPGRPRGSGRVYIVEVKAERDRDDGVNGERGAKAMELRRWEALNPNRLKYEMIFTNTDSVAYDQMKGATRFAEERETYLPIAIDYERLADFCRRWKITDLSVFGSVLRPEFSPESDVDFLAAFAPDASWGLIDGEKMSDELSGLIGRPVDLVSRRAIDRSDNWIRREEILGSAYPVYVER